MKLRDRCAQLLDKLQQDAISQEGNPVDTLLEFVTAETGRKHAGPRYEKALPIVIYCQSEEERDEFIAAYKQARPNTITKKVL